MRNLASAYAIKSQNRHVRRWAAKLRMSLAELLVGTAGGLIQPNQRRVHPVIRILVNERTKLDLKSIEAAE